MIKAMMDSYSVFSRIDNEIDKLFVYIKINNITIVTVNDTIKIKRKFIEVYNNIKKELNNTGFDKELIKSLESKALLGMYGKIHEEYGVDLFSIPSIFGYESMKEFKEAQKYL